MSTEARTWVAHKRTEPGTRPSSGAPRVTMSAREPAWETALGNLAVQDLLQQRRIQPKLRVGPPGDLFEQEADWMADRVVSGGGACHCGGTCSSCREDEVHRTPRDGGPASTSLPDRFVTQLGSGHQLDRDSRTEMESRFGHDFGAVRIHRDNQAAAAARSIGARAFTAGADIAFDQGEYRPGTVEGQRLLAHELTHVTQQEGRALSAQRAEKGAGALAQDVAAPVESQAPIESMDDFEQAVFAKAVARLAENVVKLDEWEDFLATAFDDVELMAQVSAGEALHLMELAVAHGRTQYLEPLMTTRSPASRRLYEAFVRNEIHGGCQACHESNAVWAWNAAHPELTKGPNMAEMMAELADEVDERRLLRFLESIQLEPAAPLPMSLLGPGQTATVPAPAAQPAESLIMPAPPALLVYPAPHSDLCGELPGQVTPVPGSIDPALIGPGAQMVVDAISRIHPILIPLGPSGYRILPEHIFTDLYRITPAGLRALVNQNLNERRQGYHRLSAMIRADMVDYEELCPIVEELLPRANPWVTYNVLGDISWQHTKEALLDILMGIAGVALLFLSILFPPAALVLGGLLSLAQIGVGLRDIWRGELYTSGQGARLFTAEQEAAGPALAAGGYLSVAQGIVGLGLTGYGGYRFSQQRGATALVPSRRGPASLVIGERGPSGWRPTQLPNGELMYTNPMHPEAAVFMDAQGMSLHVGDQIHFSPWATPATGSSTALALRGAGPLARTNSPPLWLFQTQPAGPLLLPGQVAVSGPVGGGLGVGGVQFGMGPLVRNVPGAVVVGPQDIAAMQARYGILPGEGVLAVARSSNLELQGLTFEGASPGIRAQTPILQTIPQVTSPRTNLQFVEHAEEGAINHFIDAVDAHGLSPMDLERNTFAMHVSQAPCSACVQGATGAAVEPGVLMNLSLRYPGLTIRVTWDLPDGGTGFLILQNGETIFSGRL